MNGRRARILSSSRQTLNLITSHRDELIRCLSIWQRGAVSKCQLACTHRVMAIKRWWIIINALWEMWCVITWQENAEKLSETVAHSRLYERLKSANRSTVDDGEWREKRTQKRRRVKRNNLLSRSAFSGYGNGVKKRLGDSWCDVECRVSWREFIEQVEEKQNLSSMKNVSMSHNVKFPRRKTWKCRRCSNRVKAESNFKCKFQFQLSIVIVAIWLHLQIRQFNEIVCIFLLS